MGKFAQAERVRRHVIPNAWEMVEAFRPYCSDAQEPLERPEPVEDLCRPLSARLYPDCPLCGANITVCPCDPDDSAEALWLKFQQEKAA